SFLYENGVYRELSDPAATNGLFASGINDVGQIVGSFDDNSGTHGFLASLNSTAAGIYGPGQTVTLTLDLSEPVIVSGAPTLTLNDGGLATYTSGSGTNALTFTYVVGPTGSGQNTSELAVTAVNGTVTDLAGNALTSVGLPETFRG